MNFIARITVVDPLDLDHDHRDQTDPWKREAVAVIDGQRACTDGHPTVEEAEAWARRALSRAGSSLQLGTDLRLAVIAAGARRG